MSAWISSATPGSSCLTDARDAGQMREGRGAGQPQPEQAAAARGDPAHPALGVVDAGQDPGRLRLQELTGRRERHLPRGAVEQRGVEFVLELADRVRQRRLRDVQLLGRLAEVAGLGHCGEISQVTQLHVLSPSGRGSLCDGRHVRR